MFDLNTILNAALTAAVEAATKPLLERIVALETYLGETHHALDTRMTALENNPAIGVDTTLLARVVVLEQSSSLDKMRLDDLNDRSLRLEGADADTTDAFSRSADRFAGIDATQRVMVERIQALENEESNTLSNAIDNLDGQEWFWEKVSRKAGQAAQAVVEEAIDEHLSGYDHDDYDRVSSAVDDLDLEALSNLESTIDNALEGKIDDCVKREELRSEIQDIMDNATVSIRL